MQFATAQAQPRAEFVSYDIRSEAGMMAGSKYVLPLVFDAARHNGFFGPDSATFMATFDIPGVWADRDIYLRDTGRTGRYTLSVNHIEVASVTSSYDTHEYLISPFLKEGVNIIGLHFSPDITGIGTGNFTPGFERKTIESLYIFSQPKIHIADYVATSYFDEQFRDTAFDLALIVANGHNTPQNVKVGFDIYDPTGKLREWVFREETIAGRSRDTVRFRTKIMGTERFRYSAQLPELYNVMLSLSLDGRNIEYIPFRFGFGGTAFDGGQISRNGQPITIKSKEVDFPTSGKDFSAPSGAVEQLRALKKQGFNTLEPIHPQQKWFYDACEQLGLYVIDRADVECDPCGGDRGPDGTDANKPALLEEFLGRQQSMFYRGRNRANIIGWSIGSESGNGFNMYRSYLWLKSADPVRPVVYRWAEGEWNTDF